MPKLREKQIEKRLVALLKDVGIAAPKYTTPSRRSAPDRLVLLGGGRCAFVECKAEGEKPTPPQEREHTKLRAMGYQVYVVDSYDSAAYTASLLVTMAPTE